MSVARQELMLLTGMDEQEASASILKALRDGSLQAVGTCVFRRTPDGIERTDNEAISWSTWETMMVDWPSNEIVRDDFMPDKAAGKRTVRGPVVKADGVRIWEGWAGFKARILEAEKLKKSAERFAAHIDAEIDKRVQSALHNAPKAKMKPGRRSGWGFDATDQIHVDRMKVLRDNGVQSDSAAAAQVIHEGESGEGPKVGGPGTRDSKIRRLRTAYKKRFGRGDGV